MSHFNHNYLGENSATLLIACEIRSV